MALYRVNKFPLPIDVIKGIPPEIHPIYGNKVPASRDLGQSPFDVNFVRNYNGSVSLTYYSTSGFVPSDTLSTSTLFAFGLTPKVRPVEMSFNYEITYTNQEIDFDLYTELDFIFGADVMYDYYKQFDIYPPDNPEPAIKKAHLVSLFLEYRLGWYHHILETYGYKSYTCHFFLELISGINNKVFFDHYKKVLEKAGIPVNNEIIIYIAPSTTGFADGKYYLANYYYGYQAPFNFQTIGTLPFPKDKTLKDYIPNLLYRNPKSNALYMSYYPVSFYADNQHSFYAVYGDYFTALNGDILLLRVYYGSGTLIDNGSHGSYYSYPSAYIVMYKNPADFERFKEILGGTLEFNKIPPLYDPTLCCLAQCFGITE